VRPCADLTVEGSRLRLAPHRSGYCAGTRLALSRALYSGVAAIVASLVLECVPASATIVPAKVIPAAGTPASTFVVSFVSPGRTGVIGSKRLLDRLTAVSAAPGKGCLSQVESSVPVARRGQRVHVRLDPFALGGRWCTGRYTGKIVELQTLVCPPGTMCPTYVRLLGTVARFTLVVHPTPAGSDTTPPTFTGLERASACTPGPQRAGETTPYTLAWQAATDDRTASATIVYDVYFADVAGAENFSKPTWTTPPGVTTFRTPGLPSHGTAYFVVRARDAAGNEDSNTREQRGLDPCL
jgi:hypothetical protein